MKKILPFVLGVLLLLCAVPMAAWADSQSTTVRYAVQAVVVYRDYDGTSATQRVDVGTVLQAPKPKGRPGCLFEGWRNEKTGRLWDFSQPVTEHMTLTASYSEFQENADGTIPIGKGDFSVIIRVENKTTDADVETSSKDILNMLLQDGSISAGELEQVAAGASLEVVLVVKNGAGTIPTASQTLLEQATEGYTIGQYLDISLVKYLTVDGQTTTSQVISQTSGAITVTVGIPAAMRNTDPNVERSYVVLRCHGGNAVMLPTTYDADKQTLTFRTNLFSDYAIAYKDTQKTGAAQADTAGGTPALLTRFIPQTGDPVNLAAYYLAWFASAAMLALLYTAKRKRK